MPVPTLSRGHAYGANGDHDTPSVHSKTLPPNPELDSPEAKLPAAKPPQSEPREPTAKEIREAFPGPEHGRRFDVTAVSQAETTPAEQISLSVMMGDRWWEAARTAKDARLQSPAAQGWAAKWYRLAPCQT